MANEAGVMDVRCFENIVTLLGYCKDITVLSRLNALIKTTEISNDINNTRITSELNHQLNAIIIEDLKAQRV